MPPISTSAEINRPAAEVFAYATDPARFHEWQEGVLDGHMECAGTPVVGTRCLTTRQIGLAKRQVSAEVTHIDPPRTWAVRGIDGPIRAEVSVHVTELDSARSRLVIDIEFAGRGIGKILDPLVIRRQARKEMPANVAALARNLKS